MRINKYLAKCGLGSRRECDKFVSNGYININGNIMYINPQVKNQT